MAVLLTEDLFMVEFPLNLLPEGVQEGMVLDMEVRRNEGQERLRRDQLKRLHEEVAAWTHQHVATFSQNAHPSPARVSGGALVTGEETARTPGSLAHELEEAAVEAGMETAERP
eukprot:TRINITY_DN27640_c0_g1_i1.p2 TRINITY_DN27640_c0_g1~~TRINITY_DN27640_c0_g1_i1.p2  ORF type:complete len:133 (+),score=24.52 TRINITY_DN27640_c0_g1_i1:58-399(+)